MGLHYCDYVENYWIKYLFCVAPSFQNKKFTSKNNKKEKYTIFKNLNFKTSKLPRFVFSEDQRTSFSWLSWSFPTNLIYYRLFLLPIKHGLYLTQLSVQEHVLCLPPKWTHSLSPLQLPAFPGDSEILISDRDTSAHWCPTTL